MVKIFKGVPYAGTLPAVLTGTKAGYLHGYKIYGNTSQEGTPTPENPIVPQECGERTANLFDADSTHQGYYNNSGNFVANNKYICSQPILASEQNYTISAINSYSGGGYVFQLVYFNANDEYISLDSASLYGVGKKSLTGSVPNSATKIIAVVTSDSSECMLVEDTTALPYEPYGYKLPLTSAGQDVDIYLGDEPLRKIGDYVDYIDYGTGKIVRQVGKIELTGNENYNKNSGSATNYLYYTPRSTLTDSISKTSVVCDRLRAVGSPPSAQIGINTINNYNMVYFNLGADIMNAQPSGNTIDGFKEYLAAQHTAGTPLTIWYVLATPAEEDPPVPFPQIPTAEGSTTISWAGQGLAPSQFDSIAEWVSATPKIYTNGAWTDAQTYVYDDGTWVADN